ncbi:MAG TPA: Calx-beta domain-containing protein [Pyrinomonadaceae bacterium]|nr:Calx-beta domain-containing protein [Pyrinomonadaceae bacterium]
MSSLTRPSGLRRAGLLIFLITLLSAQAAAQGGVSLVSVNSGGTAAGNAESRLTAVSADGRFVVFTSSSTDLVDLPDNNGGPDVFVRDRLTGRTQLVSASRNSNATGNAPSGLVTEFGSSVDISADGRYIVFQSEASDLVFNDTNGAVDVFIYDREVGVNSLVSARNNEHIAGGNAASFRPQISADGQVVVFLSLASNLATATDTNGRVDIYARRPGARTTELVNARAADGAAPDELSSLGTLASVSDDGRFVVFQSEAPDLVPNDTNGGGAFGTDVFVRDLVNGTTALVSVNAAGTGSGNLDSFAAGERISGNGRFVVFASQATDLVVGVTDNNIGSDIFIRDLVAGTTALVSVNRSGSATGLNLSQFPSVSADGRFVAFKSRASDLVSRDTNNGLEGGGGIEDIFVRDTQAGVTELVSINAAGTDSGNSSSTGVPEISADGRFVVFTSGATNLTAVTDQNNSADLFRRDLQADTTILITLHRSGTRAEGGVPIGPSLSLSADGRVVAFESLSANLVSTPDTNGALDVFVRAPLLPTISVNDVSVVEGNSGSRPANFTVTLAGGSPSGVVTARAVFLSGSARQGVDFDAAPVSLTFAPGERTKTVAASVLGDRFAEGTETFRLELRDVVGATVGDGVGIGTILDDDTAPSLTVGDVTVTEGDSGTKEVAFTVRLSRVSNASVSFEFAFSGGTAVENEDFLDAGGGALIAAGLTSTRLTVNVRGDTIDESNETFFLDISSPTGATVADGRGVGTILDDDDGGVGAPTAQFTAHVRSVNEGAGIVAVTVTRSGDLSAAAAVDFATSSSPSDGHHASDRADYNAALGRLNFAAGESSKTINVFITDDVFVEGDESFSVRLSNPTNNLALGEPAFTLVRIVDNDAAPSDVNPIDDATFFVRQHYRDFLNRDPDAAGLAFWVRNITPCGADALCVRGRRVNVSAAFFLSIEFQETGYLVYRMYKAAYGDINPPAVPVPVRFSEFLRDSQRISQGVRVGIGNWQAQLEANKNAFAEEFVARQRFTDAYPEGMPPAEFVAALDAKAGGVLSAGERNQLVEQLTAAGNTPQARARALRHVAEDQTLRDREFNKAFVLMQYFGYLRRDPDAAPDRNYNGYFFWLGKLDSFGGNFVEAEMVRAFIESIEYRRRFGP